MRIVIAEDSVLLRDGLTRMLTDGGFEVVEAVPDAGQLARDRPIVAVCRAGSRSAQATVILREAGFGNVANLSGGMLRWRAEGHAVESGSA